MTFRYYTATFFFFILLFTCDLSAQKSRSMWIWNNSNQVFDIIFNENNSRQELFKFCKQPYGNPSHKIETLFFSCRPSVYANSSNLRNFLSIAADSGLIVEFLDGDPTWATYNQDIGYERLNKVLEFNANSTNENEKLKGIQFDVEPYLLKEERGYQPPYWDTDKMEVWDLFVEFLDSCQTIVNNSNTDMYFGVAIPRWYDNQVGLDELKRLQAIVDYVAIMDYNEKSSVIINDAANEIINAEELGKNLWIGVETKEVSPETVSFFEEGVVYMETQLDSVYSVYGPNPVFNGFAIHSYAYYKDMLYEPVSVKKNDELIPEYILLEQNYPNPFNPSTNIRFFLDEPGRAVIKVYNMLGEEKAELMNDYLSAGWHYTEFTNNSFPSGIYIYELTFGNYMLTRKMLLVK